MTKTFQTIFFGLLIIVIIIVLYLILFKFDVFGVKMQKPMVINETIKNETYEIVSKFDGINLYTLNLEGIVAQGEQVLPVLVEMLKNESSEMRYAAVKGLGALGHKLNLTEKVLPHLKTALNDSDVNVRVTTAELVMSMGSKEGILVLIEELENEAILKPSEPVMPINSYCALALQEFTSQTFATDKTKWQEWWNTNKDKLKWNEENGKFTI